MAAAMTKAKVKRVTIEYDDGLTIDIDVKILERLVIDTLARPSLVSIDLTAKSVQTYRQPHGRWFTYATQMLGTPEPQGIVVIEEEE